MFIHRVIFQPTIGQVLALRDLLVADNTAATPSVVAQRLFGAPPQLVSLRGHETLGAYEAWRRGFTPNPAVVKLLGAISSELWDMTLQAPAGAPAKFSIRFTFHAAPGKIRDLRAAAEARASATNAAGLTRSSVWVRVSGGKTSVAVVDVFQGLADLEKTRATMIASAETQAYVQKIVPLLAEPFETPDIFELLAMPAQA